MACGPLNAVCSDCVGEAVTIVVGSAMVGSAVVAMVVTTVVDLETCPGGIFFSDMRISFAATVAVPISPKSNSALIAMAIALLTFIYGTFGGGMCCQAIALGSTLIYLL